MKRRSLLFMLTLSAVLMAEPVTSNFAVAYGVPVEMAITAEAATVYYPRCGSNYSSIVDGLKSIGVDSSYSNRKKIAQVNGISNYSGTAAQNTQLLNLLKQGKLIKSSTTTVYYPRCGSNYSSIVDGLKSIGVDSSYANRKTIAQANGIGNYSGTAAQNTQLLNLLKQGRLIDPKGGSGSTTNTVTTTVSNGGKAVYSKASAQVGKKYSAFPESVRKQFHWRLWCADFVSWCAKNAGQSEAIPWNASVDGLRSAIKKAGGKEYSKAAVQNGSYVPVRGDIIIFKSNGASHVGIVDYKSGNTIYYIDGNHVVGNQNGNNSYVSYSNRSVYHSEFTCILKPNYK